MENRQLARRNFLLRLGGAGLLSSPLLSAPLWAAPSGSLTGARLSGKDGILNVSFILTAEVAYKVFALKAPDRVVIDLENTAMAGNLKTGRHDRPPLQGIRYAVHDGNKLRIVLDLSQQVEISSSLNKQGNAYVLNVSLKGGSVQQPRPQPQARNTGHRNRNTRQPAPQNRPVARRGEFVVVIDPGHGGHDPGAVGRKGTREKDVVLEVSRKLKARIDATPGMRAILTRSQDTYVPLRKRIEIARKSRGNLFISVHADANPSSRVKGSSVYILSENGASSEAARLLAKSENSYELKLGNVDLGSNDDNVASILLDLSQNETLDRSLDLANSTLSELSRISNPLRPKVESAGFVVLKAPDIPSMLVETAFISNPNEEHRLRTPNYQQKLADAMFRGVKRYKLAHFDVTPGEAEQQFAAADIGEDDAVTGGSYIVRPGDSLSEIAEQHGVSVSDIKQENELRSSIIRTGQTLKIPTNT